MSVRLNDINLRLLRVFQAVVETEGVSAAEERLNIRRSMISIHLTDLESRLGMILCVRGRGGFELTDAGRTIYDALIKFLNRCDTFLDNIQSIRGSLQGQLNIAIIDACLMDKNLPLHKAISAMAVRHPDVVIELIVAPSDEIEMLLLNGRINVGLCIRKLKSSALEFEPLYDEVSYVYCADKHPLATQDQTRINAMMADVPYIQRSYIRGEEPFSKFNANGPTAFGERAESVVHLILTGQFVGILPTHVAGPFEAEGLMRRVPLEGMEYRDTVGVLQPIREKKNPLVQEFVELLHHS